MSDKIDVLDRIGRPLLRLVGVAFALMILWLVARIGMAVAAAFERSAIEGQPVPDMSGGLPGIISALAVAVPAIGAFILDQVTRHREKRDRIAREAERPRPTPPAGSREPDDLNGPRPGENWQ